MPSHCQGIFGNLPAGSESGIGNNLVIRYLIGGRCIVFSIPFIIMYCVTDGILRPMCIDSDILSYRLVPVIGGSGFIRCGEPALESVVFPCRIIWLGRIETIFIGL